MISEELIIQGLVRSVKGGNLTLKQVPEKYRVEVEAKING